METIDYQKQGTDFLTRHGLAIDWQFVSAEKVSDANMRRLYRGMEPFRNHWRWTLKRGALEFSSEFTDSIKSSTTDVKFSNLSGAWEIKNRREQPTAYDLLACLQKSDPGSFEDFCGDFGYSTDSISARDTYLAVQREYHGLRRVIPAEAWEEFEQIA